MGGPLCDQISEVNAAEADEGAVLEVGDPSFQMGTAALISWGSSLETPVLVEGGDKDLGAFWAALPEEHSWGSEESCTVADAPCVHDDAAAQASASLVHPDSRHDLGPVVSLREQDTSSMSAIQHHATSSSNVDDNASLRYVVEAPSMLPTLHHATLSSKVDEKARPRPRREVEEPAPHGFARVQGLLVRKSQLPSRWEETLENNMEQLRQRSELLATLSSQQVLRLVLSADLDVDVAAQSFERTLTWRRENCMEVERARVRAQIHSIGDDTPVRFPYHNEVCRKLMAVSPCALVTEDGQPVTFYHIGTSNTKEVASLDPDHVVEFGRGILEYVDEWVQQHSDRTGQLLGHVLVFDLGGLSWSQLWCKDIHEKLKASLGMGGYYVEVVAHIYVLNTSALFSSVWKLVKQLIPARTSTKITVANGLAPELVERFSPRSVERLKRILSGAGKGPPPEVLRPPVGP